MWYRPVCGGFSRFSILKTKGVLNCLTATLWCRKWRRPTISVTFWNKQSDSHAHLRQWLARCAEVWKWTKFDHFLSVKLKATTWIPLRSNCPKGVHSYPHLYDFLCRNSKYWKRHNVLGGFRWAVGCSQEEVYDDMLFTPPSSLVISEQAWTIFALTHGCAKQCTTQFI